MFDELERLRAEVKHLRQYVGILEGTDMGMNSNNSGAGDAGGPIDASNSGNNKSGSNAEKEKEKRYGRFHLSRDEIDRYSRQMLLPDFGPRGTARLRQARVLVVGAGGLASTVIPYLAAAGVGFIRVVDFDVVELSNLHRQVMHPEQRAGLPKALSALLTASSINSACEIEPVMARFDIQNAQSLVSDVDCVVDASDNVAARYLVNDACVLERKPLISGSATRWEGQLTVYNANQCSTKNKDYAQCPCYRCLFPVPPPASAVGNCSDVGVCGPVPGAIGCLQALEAIKVILLLKKKAIRLAVKDDDDQNDDIADIADTTKDAVFEGTPHNDSTGFFESTPMDLLAGRMLLFDGLRMTFKVVKMRPRQPQCAMCAYDHSDDGGVSVVADTADDAKNNASTTAINNTNDNNISSSGNNNKKRPFNSLTEAFFEKGMFPEYLSGIPCQTSNSAPRIDALFSSVAPPLSSPTEPAQAADTATATPTTGHKHSAVLPSLSVGDQRIVEFLPPVELENDCFFAGGPSRQRDVAALEPQQQQQSNHKQSEDENVKEEKNDKKKGFLVVDVRPCPQSDIVSVCDSASFVEAMRRWRRHHEEVSAGGSASCSTKLPPVLPLELSAFQRDPVHCMNLIAKQLDETASHQTKTSETNNATTMESDVVFVCRRGNKSRTAIHAVIERALKQHTEGVPAAATTADQEPHVAVNGGPSSVSHRLQLYNLIGGLEFWSRDYDATIPAI